MEKTNIQAMVFSFLDSIRAERRPLDDGGWNVFIPEEERGFFNGYEEYSFTFDRELAEKHRELEFICEGSYILRKIIERVASIPKVSRLFGNFEPELPILEPGKSADLRLLSPGKVFYRQKVQFFFKVTFLCDRREDRLFSLVADPAGHDIYLKEGVENIDVSKFSPTPNPAFPIEESGEEILRLYLRACQKLESLIKPQVAELKDELEKDFGDELGKIGAFLDEQKQELQRKKENVCFHLYFFQKEEEIENMIRDLDEEQNRKTKDLREKYRLKVEIQLVNAVVLCIPTIGVSGNYLTKKKRDGFESITRREEGGNLQALPIG